MTLIVSLRILDGVVIAGDSLSTLMGQRQLEAAPIDVTCPKCTHNYKIQPEVEEFAVPGTTFSYAQKVFPFRGRFGVGTFGVGLLADKSIYFIMRLFEQESKKEQPINGVTEAAEKIGNEIHNFLIEQLELEKVSIDALPDDQALLGFQVVGYDGLDPKTIEVFIGKRVVCRPINQLGCTISGSKEVVQAIWGLYKKEPQSQPPYPAFSLQDAIDYAAFLIRTTIDHQRFSQAIPNVGGDIDIALVTPFDGFQWIRQKELGRILGGKAK